MISSVTWDEDFEDVEKPDVPAVYTVTITYQPGGGYIATWAPEGEASYHHGSSVATVLRLLANELDGEGTYGSSDEALQIALETQSLCKYCGAPILFARIPPRGSWLAFDITSITAETVPGLRVASLRKNGLNFEANWPTSPTGPVFVPHPEVCGRKPRKPEHAALIPIWEPRHALVKRKKKDEKEKLAQQKAALIDEIQQDLMEGIAAA